MFRLPRVAALFGLLIWAAGSIAAQESPPPPADNPPAASPAAEGAAAAESAPQAVPPLPGPNVVLIFMDDMGYGDLSGDGRRGYETRNLARLEREGMRLTSFLVPQAVCGASRAGLLSGCYPNRIGMLGAPGPNSRHGINSSEVLIPEILKAKGYATGMVGKWHLGHHPPFLPVHHGFDDYFGLPYSNDMWPFHPETPKAYPDLPLVEGDRILNPRVTAEDQENLTSWYTERSIQFLRDHAAEPFFLYVAHSMPHVPLYGGERFRGVTAQGRYGDIMQEIDWSVGEILGALDELKLADNTLVIFTSDNGPWLSYGNHAGSASPLREGKGTAWEGGVRVPCLMRWPGVIPRQSVCHELVSTIDILPTLASVVGAPLPNHPIDGLDVSPLLRGDFDARTPHESFYYYWGNELHAIRSGDWKLHFPHPYRSLSGPPGADGRPAGYTNGQTGLALYNLSWDIGETQDRKAEFPEVLARLEVLAELGREELGDSLRMRKGYAIRPPAQIEVEKK